MFKKARKGNMIAVVLFATMMGIMSIGTFSVANVLYATNTDSANRYARLQSYRSASEIAVYQYCRDIQSVFIDRNFDTEFLSATRTSVYNNAIYRIVNKLGSAEEPLQWRTRNIASAIEASGITNSAITVNLVSLLNDGRDSFTLTLEDYPELNWLDAGNGVVGSTTYIGLTPLKLNMDLWVKGEHLTEEFTISGLYLCIVANDTVADPSAPNLTMNIVEGERGVRIYRERS